MDGEINHLTVTGEATITVGETKEETNHQIATGEETTMDGEINHRISKVTGEEIT